MALIKMLSGDPPGQCVELKSNPLVIGRAPECDIVLDPNGVSRRHAQIIPQGERFFIDDLHSRNTTKVNNVVLVPGKGKLLEEGDRVNICDVEFVFHESAASAAGKTRDASEMLVTDQGTESPYHMLDASVASSHSMTVRPELKLAAILEISRNLHSDLSIDGVAPRSSIRSSRSSHRSNAGSWC